MEYMRIEGFLGAAFSRLINKAVETKTGFKPGIDIQNLNLSTTQIATIDMRTEKESEVEDKVVLDLTVSMTKKAFEKLIEEATK